MAEKRFDTRILLKYDSLSNWNSSSLVLKAGEVAIATVPTTEAVTKQDGVITPPAAVVFKVGDGEHVFKDLPIVSALAADVYGWAKKSEDEFKTWLSGDAGFATDAELAAVKSALDAKDEALEELINAIEGGGEGSGSEGGLTGVYSRLSDLETILVSFLPEGEKTADAVKVAIDAVAGRVATLESEVATLKSGASAMNADIASLKAVVGEPVEGEPSLSEKIGSVAEDVEAIDGKIGEVAEGKNIVGMIGEAEQAAKDHTNTEIGKVNTAVAGINSDIAGLEERVGANEDAIAVLNGTSEGSVDYKVASAIADVVASAPDDFDTLKEIADYIASDKTGATEINNKLAAHDTDIAGLKAADVTLGEEIDDLQEQITAIVGGEGVKGTLVALEERVKANEDAIGVIEEKLGEVAEGKTLAGLISDNAAAITALQAKDTELAGLVSGNADAIAAEKERAEGAEATLLEAINDEAARADAAEKANKALIDTLDAKINALHAVASSGMINDLAQKEDEDLIFDCGNATGYNA